MIKMSWLMPQRLSEAALIAALTTSLTMTLSPAQAAAATPPQREQLTYSVSYNGARVAAVQLHSGCPAKTYRPMALVASSVGLLDAVVTSFIIRFDTFLGLADAAPREGHSKITEDGATRTYRTTFHPALTPRVRSSVRGQDYDWRLPALPARPHDMLSWMYALREDQALTSDTRRRMLVWDGWKLFWLDVRAARPTALTTPAGRFDALPISLTRQRIHHDGDAPARLFKPSRDPEPLGTLWLRDDARRTPVGIDFASPIGAVIVRLERAQLTPCD